MSATVDRSETWADSLADVLEVCDPTNKVYLGYRKHREAELSQPHQSDATPTPSDVQGLVEAAKDILKWDDGGGPDFEFGKKAWLNLRAKLAPFQESETPHE